MKVLIADESDVIRDRLSTLLFDTFKSIEILNASNLSDAIQLIKKDKPDVVILDIRVSSGDGIYSLKEIKSIPSAPITIVFTQSVYAQYRRKCMEIGTDYFLIKSNDFDKIPDLLKKISKKIT
ncbi:MAG: response regulator [Candidatus Latescibacteria bacterium]|nr:response regulator [Candidatus Latescibacterota bacterium]